MKVKELVDFEEIKDVIDIDRDLIDEEKSKELVGNYIISENLKEHLQIIFEDLAKPKHKSCQIIGNYGSGKSHLLAFLSALLDNPDLAPYIQDEDVLNAYKNNINRRFAVVQFELQSNDVDVSKYFYDYLRVKLKKKYDIEIKKFNPYKVLDHKAKVAEILNKIKEHDPQMGLIVIIDEISDFLKQRDTKEKKTRDIQFMRVLAQASQSMDFMLIGAMQENIFTSSEFLDERESFGRTAERYRLITISKEDIKKVVSQRSLSKTLEQREKLEELLEEYANQISEVHSRLNEFIDLYPVHPYVIKIVTQLPYFEKRGVIQFTGDEVKKILDKEFPQFITFDKIYDLLAGRHSIKSLDEVSEIVNAIDTLDSKIPLLRDNLQEDARKIIKALAVLKLYGKTSNNGATPEELANELLIISDKFSGSDRIEMILTKLREVTDGQFIAKNKNNYYYIDLDHTIDYDVIIKRKMENLYEGAEDEVLLRILRESFELDYDSKYERVYTDYSYWPDKKSFRYGSFIYDDGSSYVKRGDGDFNFVFVSPYLDSTTVKKDADMAVLNLEYDDELDILLKRAAAIESLIKSSPHPKNVMRSRLKECNTKLRKKLLDKIINAKVENGGSYSGSGSLLSQQPDTLAEYYYKVKPALFGSYFSNKYDKYPKLANQISPENIKGEVERTIDDILGGNEKVTVSNSQNLLNALGLLDSDNYTDTSNSSYARLILNKLKDNQGKNVKIEETVEELAEAPYGLNRELVYLILVVLTYNGEANLKKRGSGITITASELKQELSSGLNKFDEIPYITLETDFPIDEVTKVFKELDLNPGLIRQKKDRPHALREFRDKVLDLEKQIEAVDRQLKNFKKYPDEFINIDVLVDKRKGLKNIPISKFKKAKTVAGLKKTVLSDMELENLKIGLKFLENITKFLDDFEANIYEPYIYLEKSIDFVKDHSTFFSDEDVNELKKIAKKCEDIVDDLTAILEFEDRRILKGKLQQYQSKYKSIYAKQHEQKVGSGVDWDKLEEIENNQELKELKVLKGVRGLNTAHLSRLEIQIGKLSQIKCNRLEEEYLEESYKCPYCGFPEYDDPILENINETLDEMWDQIFDIKDEWEEQILNEIENYQDNIRLLDPAEKQLINEIKDKEALPERIDRELVVALNNLFSELREIEVSGQEIKDIIFNEAGVLDYKAFVNKLEEVKEKILEQGDRSNIRIKKAADE